MWARVPWAPASPLLHASQPSILVWQRLWARFSVPPNSGLRPFFRDTPGASASALLRALQFQSGSACSGGRILGPPNTGPRPFFRGALEAPTSVLLCAAQFGLPARAGTGRILGPPEYLFTTGLLVGGNGIANETPNTVALNNYLQLLKYIPDINRSAHFVVFALPPRNFDAPKVDIMTFNKLLQSFLNHMASIVTVMQTFDTFAKKKEVTLSDFDPNGKISVAASYKKFNSTFISPH